MSSSKQVSAALTLAISVATLATTNDTNRNQSEAMKSILKSGDKIWLAGPSCIIGDGKKARSTVPSGPSKRNNA